MQSGKISGNLFGEVPELLQEWAERETTARLLVDTRLMIYWANRPAELQLARRRDLESRDGFLHATDPSNHAALVDFIHGAAAGLSSLSFPCADGDGHLLLRCLELRANGHERYFGLVFYRSGSEFVTSYADLERVFNLTSAEHRVLLDLLDGHTADEIATLLNVSIETTRSHIRQIYQKLAVTSREGMFSILRPYRIS